MVNPNRDYRNKQDSDWSDKAEIVFPAASLPHSVGTSASAITELEKRSRARVPSRLEKGAEGPFGVDIRNRKS